MDLKKVEKHIGLFSKNIIDKLDDEIFELKKKSAKTKLDEAYNRSILK